MTEELALEIFHGRKPVFITGAGLSVASGIRPYRGGKNAIWKQFVWEWGTKAKFFEDSKRWWNKFWLETHENISFLSALPNSGHDALRWIVEHTLHSKIITQNIDQLHLKSGVPNERLIEIHGRLGLYRCTNLECIYSFWESIQHLNLDSFAREGTSLVNGDLKLKKAPVCPGCYSPILPQSLLFDEDYDSHSFYRCNMADQWLKESDIFVFVGTSFSVGITQKALELAEQHGKKIYNFNLYKEDAVAQNPNIKHIEGAAEDSLPELMNNLQLLVSRRRIWMQNQYVFNHPRLTNPYQQQEQEDSDDIMVKVM